MKRLLMIMALGGVVFVTGCAMARSPVGNGILFTSVSGSESVSSNNMGSKKGEACAMNILGLIAVGDASIQEAADDARITKISHVDYDTFTILGWYAQSCTVVHGE